MKQIIGMDHTPDDESETDDGIPMIHLRVSVISVVNRSESRRMLRCHGNGNPAARIKASRHSKAPRPADGDEVIQDAIDRRLVKGSVVAEGKKIKLQ